MIEPLFPDPEPATTSGTDAPATAAGQRPLTRSGSILLEEIRILRERGLSDECIHGLLRGFNIDAHPERSGDLWKTALDDARDDARSNARSNTINDQMIRLIWGNSASLETH